MIEDEPSTLPQFCLDCDVRFACHGACPKDRYIRTPDGEPGLNYLCSGSKACFHRRRANAGDVGAPPPRPGAVLRADGRLWARDAEDLRAAPSPRLGETISARAAVAARSSCAMARKRRDALVRRPIDHVARLGGTASRIAR